MVTVPLRSDSHGFNLYDLPFKVSKTGFNGLYGPDERLALRRDTEGVGPDAPLVPAPPVLFQEAEGEELGAEGVTERTVSHANQFRHLLPGFLDCPTEVLEGGNPILKVSDWPAQDCTHHSA